MAHVPVPEVEHEHHERAEERREADERANEQAEADEQLAPRDGDVRELDEPRRATHPREHARERVAVRRRDVRQVAAGGELAGDLREPGVRERVAHHEAEREYEPRAEAVDFPADGQAADSALELVHAGVECGHNYCTFNYQ